MKIISLSVAIVILLVTSLLVAFYFGSIFKSENGDPVVESGSKPPLLAIINKLCEQQNCTRSEFYPEFTSCADNLSATRSCIAELAQNQEIKDKCINYIDSLEEYGHKIKTANEILLFIDFPFANPNPLRHELTDITGIKEQTNKTLTKLGNCVKTIAALNK